MEEDSPNFWAHLRRVKFRKIRLADPTSEPTNASTEAFTTLTTVPDFSTRYPWHFSTTAAFEFLRQLPLISVATLPEDKRACDICYEPYASSKHAEKPTKLPCQHTLGRRCIGIWILPQTARPNTTCPMCRSELFNDAAFRTAMTSPSEEGDVADWVRETSFLYEGDSNADERMELLVKEIQRVGSVVSRWPTAETGSLMQGLSTEHDDAIQRFESDLASLSERLTLGEHIRDIPQLLEASRELRATSERLHHQALLQMASLNDRLGGQWSS